MTLFFFVGMVVVVVVGGGIISRECRWDGGMDVGDRDRYARVHV